MLNDICLPLVCIVARVYIASPIYREIFIAQIFYSIINRNF